MLSVHTGLIVLLLVLLVGCGGGGGGSSDPVQAGDTAPSSNQPEPEDIQLLDSSPAAGAAAVDADISAMNFSHLAHTDLSISLSGDCPGFSGSSLRRSLVDVSGSEFEELVDHHVNCSPAENTSYLIIADGTRSNDERFRASLAFSTGNRSGAAITVQDSVTTPRETINELFGDYIEGALLSDWEVPGLVGALIIDLITDLAADNWEKLIEPDALYDVVAERVTYHSRTPSGEPSDNLSGLVARPLIDSNFVPRDRFIILGHATGSTPGDLNTADAWFILANLFAARGYLVVAADNYGRGATSEAEETYLMANQTAHNTLDLVRQVLDDTEFTAVYSGREAAVIGYSQGGHTAMAVWLMEKLQGFDDLDISRVYAGGAPHNLFETVRGVLSHLDDSCESAYCEYVDEDTTVPFATDRILPALLSYTDTELTVDDLVIDDQLTATFISGFLSNDAKYDTLKALLQLNSFTGINNIDVLSGSNTEINLYHSNYDRLVPVANTNELFALLDAGFTVDYHQSRCNSEGYETIFNTTDRVGLVHTLCGLSVLNDVMEDLQ